MYTSHVEGKESEGQTLHSQDHSLLWFGTVAPRRLLSQTAVLRGDNIDGDRDFLAG